MENSIKRYVRELYKWNKRINLTGISDEKIFLQKIIEENLKVLNLIKIDKKKKLVDVGAGNGNLSILMALKFEKNLIYAVEKNSKKCVFLRRIKRVLNLPNLKIVEDKIENISFKENDNLLLFMRGIEFNNLNLEKIMKKFSNSLFLFLIGEKSRGNKKITNINFPLNFETNYIELDNRRLLIVTGKKIDIL